MLNASNKYALDGAMVAKMPELIEAAALKAAIGLLGEGYTAEKARIMPDRAAVMVSIADNATDVRGDPASSGADACCGQDDAWFFSEVRRFGAGVFCGISDELLGCFASAAGKEYVAQLPEELSVPVSGVAPDGEASAYARALLYTYSRSGASWRFTAASRNALFRCLLLYSTPADELERAHSSAVRSVLLALNEQPLGGVNSAVMQAALRYTENLSSKINK